MSLLDADIAWTRLGDCYTVTKKPRGLDTDTVAVIPFAAMEAIPQGGAYEPTFTPKEPRAISSGTYFERGDILVSKITPSFENGKQALVRALPQAFGYATTEVIPLRPSVEGQDPRLLFFYLLHPDIRHHVAERMEGSTGRQRVPEGVLLDLPVPVIAPQDQMAMADALETIQAAVAAERVAEATAQELKRAAMRELFTRGLRGEAQKETEIGLVPESWEVLPLSSICVETDQVSIGEEGDRLIQYIDVSSISRESLSVETTSQYILRNAPGRARKRVKTGDVIFATIRPTLCRVARIASELDNQVCSTAFCVLRADGSDDFGRLIFYATQRPEFVGLLARVETGASYPAVTDKQVKAQLIPIPKTTEEQREIVTILDALDRKIALHRQKRAVLEELFQSLLHKLMTGEICVADLDLSALTQTPEATA